MEALDDICAEGKVTTCGSRVSDASSDGRSGGTCADRKEENGVENTEIRKDGYGKAKKLEEKGGKKSEEKSRKRMVRLPKVRDRRKAREEGRVHAFGVKGEKQSWVCLSKVEALEKGKDEDIKLFDEWTDIARNIKAASKWVVREAEPGSLDARAKTFVYERTTLHANDVDSNSGIGTVAWNTDAKPFVPRCVSVQDNGQERELVTSTQRGPVLVRAQSHDCHDVKKTVRLRDLLHHPQVSHVRPVEKKVRKKMDTFKKCGHDRWELDLRGTTAKQIQRRLREQLVEDLKAGNDEAAFVCSQLGIDSVPRADQLELMVAAMPGVTKLIFEGATAKSGLDLQEWKKGHATHCSKCTEDEINDDCYFKVIFHFLRCGYDPELAAGKSWEDFKKQFPAYVDLWRGDEERCRAAWQKWVKHSEGLLSEPTEKEPEFTVPLLPATRSKHKWRYVRYGIPYKVRLCLDLKAAQVNEAAEDWKFRYRALDDVAANLKKGDWLASVDISRFYLRLPAGQKLRSVQWVQDPESYAHTTKLNNKSKRKLWRQLQAIGFGLKTAPAWASVVSAELVRILEAEGIRVVGCFLDDLLIAASTKQQCQKALDKAQEMMGRLGIPANEKTIPPQAPDEGIVFLGVHIRTADMRFTISEEHRAYAIDRVSVALDEGAATKGDLASIAGVLNWISYVFIPGRPRRQIIYDAARLGSSGKKKDRVVIEGALQRQLQWWKNSLKHANFVGSRIWDMQSMPKTMLVRSDASGEDGWGACVHGFHFAGPWPEDLKDEHMLFKEMVPVTITIALLSAVLPETVFGVAVDNTGVAFAVNKLSCRDRITLRLLQQLTADLDAGGHTVLGAHIRRHRNEHTDEMSHALAEYLWERITRHQQFGKRVTKSAYWMFPFVAQELSTGDCVSGCFRMRRSLFARIKDVSTT